MLSVLVNIFAAPRSAFAALRDRPLILLPLLLMVIGVALINYMYFSAVDPEFMVEDMLAQAGDDMTAEESAQTREGIESMAGAPMKWFSVLGGTIGMTGIIALHALYFLIVSMFTGTGFKYRHWFSFITWSNMPTVLALVASLVTLLLAGGADISLGKLNPFTLNNLFGLDVRAGNLKSLAEIFDLTRIWSCVLMVVGYQVWTGRSWLHSAAVVLLPVGLLIVVMLAF